MAKRGEEKASASTTMHSGVQKTRGSIRIIVDSRRDALRSVAPRTCLSGPARRFSAVGKLFKATN